MIEIMEGYAYLISSWIGFLPTLKFSDGVSVGGFILAVSIMGILIDFIFGKIRRDRPYDSVKSIKSATKSNNNKTK